MLNRLLKNGFNSLLKQAKDGLLEDQASSVLDFRPSLRACTGTMGLKKRQGSLFSTS